MQEKTAILQKADLYEQDFYAWTERQVELLLSGHLGELDIDNLAEEVATIGRSERSAVRSNLQVILMRLVKYQLQPTRRSRSWRLTLLEHRKRLERDLADSPSLVPYAQQKMASIYSDARDLASLETELMLDPFPESCPYSFEEVLDPDFLPAAA